MATIPEPIDIKIDTGQSVHFDFTASSRIESFFAIALAKTGSTLLHRMLTDICIADRYPIIDMHARFFARGIKNTDWMDCESLNELVKKGYAYIGFRIVPRAIVQNPVFRSSKKILMIRDPRDVAVSMYFSIVYSHRVPKKGDISQWMDQSRKNSIKADIDKWVRQVMGGPLRARWTDFINLYQSSDDCLLIRYEDIIFDKLKMVNLLCDYLGITLDVGLKSAIAEKHHILPSKERISNHIRKATPGDHKEKLSAETIEFINEAYSDAMQEFNYDTQ